MFIIKDKVAIVTGGASGIGFNYAVALLRSGLKAVTLADVDETKGEEAVTRLTEDFGPNKVLFVKTDVTDKSQLENAFKKTVEVFQNLDIVINNAGVMNDAIWEKEIAINLQATVQGCFLAMEEYLPKYRSGEEGVVVNISSILGLSAETFLPVYIATKHAIIGLGRSLGLKGQYDSCKVKVVTICPGGTDTALIKDLHNKMLNERYLQLLSNKATEASREKINIQPPEAVAKCLIKAIEEGESGSIWVAEANEIYEIELSERENMKKK